MASRGSAYQGFSLATPESVVNVTKRKSTEDWVAYTTPVLSWGTGTYPITVSTNEVLSNRFVWINGGWVQI